MCAMFSCNFANTRYMQYLSVCIATLTISSISMYGAWPSPVLLKLKESNTLLLEPISDEEGSWIASSSTLATAPSCLFAAWLINKIGRKGSMLFCSIILFVPWILLFFADTTLKICIARVIGGFSFGTLLTSTAMYSGEVAEVDIRGKLGFIIAIMKLLGTFIILAVGPFVSYNVLIIVCAIVPVVFFILMLPMPESPYHLVLKGRNNEARMILKRLSRSDATEGFINKRLLEIEEIVENDMVNKDSLWEFLSNIEYRQALIISIGVKTLNQLSGAIAIDSYMQTIISESGSIVSPEISSIIFGSVQIPAALLGTFLVDRLGRKPLLVFSAFGCALAMASEGIYFYMQSAGYNVHTIHWLPTTGIVGYLILSNIGITSVPTVLLSELFPTNIKATAIAMTTFYGGTLAFLVSKFFKPVSNKIGMHYTFFIFTAVCVCGIFFVQFYTPETKSKNFVEIQTKLNKKYLKKKLRQNARLEAAAASNAALEV